MARGKGRAGWEWLGIIATTGFGAVIVRGWPPGYGDWTPAGLIVLILAVVVAARIVWCANQERQAGKMTGADFPTALGVAVAIVALAVGFAQLVSGRETQREASARDAYKEYLKLAIERPRLAEGISTVEGKSDLPQISDIRKKDKQAAEAVTKSEDLSYRWFVSYLLFSSEQIYQMFPGNSEWNATLASQLRGHREFLQSEAFQGADGCDKELVRNGPCGEKSHYDKKYVDFVNASIFDWTALQCSY